MIFQDGDEETRLGWVDCEVSKSVDLALYYNVRPEDIYCVNNKVTCLV